MSIAGNNTNYARLLPHIVRLYPACYLLLFCVWFWSESPSELLSFSRSMPISEHPAPTASPFSEKTMLQILTSALLAAGPVYVHRQRVLRAVCRRTEDPATLHHAVLKEETQFSLFPSFFFIAHRKHASIRRKNPSLSERVHLSPVALLKDSHWTCLPLASMSQFTFSQAVIQF